MVDENSINEIISKYTLFSNMYGRILISREVHRVDNLMKDWNFLLILLRILILMLYWESNKKYTKSTIPISWVSLERLQQDDVALSLRWCSNYNIVLSNAVQIPQTVNPLDWLPILQGRLWGKVKDIFQKIQRHGYGSNNENNEKLYMNFIHGWTLY